MKQLFKSEYNDCENPIFPWGWSLYRALCGLNPQYIPTKMGFIARLLEDGQFCSGMEEGRPSSCI